MKLLDTSVILLFIKDIDGKKYFSALISNGEILKIPPSVYNEIKDTNTRTELDNLLFQHIIGKVDHNDMTIENVIRTRYPELNDGEINVICSGLKLKENGVPFFCVIDEKPGRKAAQELGLPLTGSIGLLNILKAKGLLDKSQRIKITDEIKQSAFWIDDEILRVFINE
ncbi:putative nucleic acid-binding protein [Methanocella conradii HZ254]|uniref:Nucleic acid-binding protein n=1 Tax=Methanocella conradii (strain DSM 24694 / JCM 17849 / CGMCC 1.5162 / HZ254) TaxID=1041930 RepID=H8I6S4_METCZ|nr:nucleic acid-binding protein [Methanocella conradii]AFC99394.1 putative nucleic acid-binding protein [Methanocella conradii HZ254]